MGYFNENDDGVCQACDDAHAEFLDARACVNVFFYWAPDLHYENDHDDHHRDCGNGRELAAHECGYDHAIH